MPILLISVFTLPNLQEYLHFTSVAKLGHNHTYSTDFCFYLAKSARVPTLYFSSLTRPILLISVFYLVKSTRVLFTSVA